MITTISEANRATTKKAEVIATATVETGTATTPAGLTSEAADPIQATAAPSLKLLRE
jgi:hypothetical protein